MVQKKAIAKSKNATPAIQKKQNVDLPKKSIKNKRAVEAALAAAAAAAVAAKPQKRKGAGKVPVKVVPPPKPVVEEESDDDEDDDDEDEKDEQENDMQVDEDESDEEESGVEQGDDDGDEDEDDEEEEDDDDDDEDDDSAKSGDDSESETEPTKAKLTAAQETADNDDDDNDDDPPEEAPIPKQPKNNLSNNLKVPIGAPPKGTPDDQIVIVSNLPENYIRLHLLQIFSKYGEINRTNLVKGQRFCVLLVYNDSASAKSASTATGIKFCGRLLNVSLGAPKVDNASERSVRLSCLNPITTIETLTEHFSSCGSIEKVLKFFGRGEVRFTKPEFVKEAVKLNNTTVDDYIIQVVIGDHEFPKDADHTINVANTIDAKSYSSDVLANIFKEVGEIENIEIICQKTLAFVTFKDDSAAKKALELDGKTFNELTLKLDPYKSIANQRVVVQNLSTNATESDLQRIFGKVGEIDNIYIKNSLGVIQYKTVEGFCKAFTLNEIKICGKPVFLEPFSKRKSFYKSKALGPKGNFHQKRPIGGHGNGHFQNFKRPRT